MISLYFGEQLKNNEKAEEITNLAKEQIRLGINPNFSTLKFSINRLIGNSLLRVTYVALFLLILMFALILFLNYTNNSLNTNPVSISNDAPIDNDINKNEIIEENNKKRERENKNLVATNSSILKKQEEKKLETKSAAPRLIDEWQMTFWKIRYKREDGVLVVPIGLIIQVIE